MARKFMDKEKNPENLEEKKFPGSFTLIELIISVMIVAVLMAIAVPGYNNMKFRSEEDKARFNLQMIFQAQKLYWFNPMVDENFRSYVTPGNINLLKSYVDISTDDGDWSYSIVSANQSVFTAKALHKKLPGPKEIYINQTGTITRNY